MGKGTGTLVIVFIVGMVAGHFILPKLMGMMGTQSAYARSMAVRRYY